MLRTFYSIRKICYLLLAVIGVPVNLVAIVILSRGKCGLSTCTTRYLVAMAVADLLIIIANVIMRRIHFYYFPGSLLNVTFMCRALTVFTRAFTDCSVWFTVTFTFDRFVAICWQKRKIKYRTEKKATVVLGTTCILLCVKNIPVYFIFEPGEIINNVPWFCKIKPTSYTEAWWVGFDWFDTVLNPLLPFAFILLLNALTVRYILMTSRVRKALKDQSQGDDRSDPEMQTRRKSVILLFAISGSFILLWLIYVINFLYYTITGTNPKDYADSLYILKQVGFILRNVSCCTNTFIYGVTQSKFREQFLIAVNCPLTSIGRLIKKENK